ncbi:MAG: hypothetical protein NTY70_07045 [Burkholderiales bacterium]|nr:hypothetical protein [Burkholderiales bacterium]
MSEFIIDAPLLACPNPNNFLADEFQEVFTDYLTRLSDLIRLRSSCKSIKFWRDEQLSLVLHEHNYYPFGHNLREAFDGLHDQQEFQIQDIITLATSLLERSLAFEEIGDIKDIVVSNYNLIDDVVEKRTLAFQEHLCRSIALALPLLGDGDNFKANTYLASCGTNSSPEYLTVNYQIDMTELKDGTICESPQSQSVKVESYRGIISLFENADLVTWWATATNDSVLDTCSIQAGLNSESIVHTMERLRKNISIGRNFISSAKSLNFMTDHKKIGRLLKACCELLTNQNLANSHWLRAGKGANDVQRSRGDWRAWRHDIDDEFHLHYWKLRDRIELANVVVHNDFEIS